MDDSTTYAAGWTKNKLCIDWGFEQVYLYCMDDEEVRKFAANSTPTKYNNVNQLITLPSDFFRIYKVSQFDFTTDPGLVYTGEFFDYEIAYNGTAYVMQLTNINYPASLYIRYIKQLVPMTVDGSIPTGIPTLLQRCIADFALARYYRLHRDMANYSAALQIAQESLRDRLCTYRTYQ